MIHEERSAADSEPLALKDIIPSARSLVAGHPDGLLEQLAVASERMPWLDDRRGVERGPLDEQLRIAVLRRDRFMCRWCGHQPGGPRRLQVDHVIPWSAGGVDHPVNLRALCVACNQDRSNRVTDAWAARQQLPIVFRCQGCAPNPDSWDLGVTAFCLTCNRTARSPYELLGGPIPEVGVPQADSWLRPRSQTLKNADAPDVVAQTVAR